MIRHARRPSGGPAAAGPLAGPLPAGGRCRQAAGSEKRDGSNRRAAGSRKFTAARPVLRDETGRLYRRATAPMGRCVGRHTRLPLQSSSDSRRRLQEAAATISRRLLTLQRAAASDSRSLQAAQARRRLPAAVAADGRSLQARRSSHAAGRHAGGEVLVDGDGGPLPAVSAVSGV
jgi:hypothetical protein